MASKTTKKTSPVQDASKKRSKPAVANSVANDARSESPTVDSLGQNGGEAGYLREIEKRIRNTSKKISAMQKVISLVAEHPNATVDELVSKNIINKDQREQYLKKPELEKQLAQLHEQRDQFSKFEDDLKRQFEADKANLAAKHEKELEAARADTSKSRENYLILSKFLCAAASRRNEADENSPETQAFEGLLLAFYNGNSESVDAMHNLVVASDDIVPSTSGEATGVTYARVKELSAPHGYEPEANGVAADSEAIVDKLTDTTLSDPTITHAGLTETADVDQAEVRATTEGSAELVEPTAVDESAANAAAADQWDESKASSGADGMGDSWVAIPRDASEVENQANGSAAGGQTQAWADEPVQAVAEPVVRAEPMTSANDGFHEVHHNRTGSRRGGGGPRGGRGGGFHRGRGDGSRGRGRGGESRGGRGRGRGRGD